MARKFHQRRSAQPIAELNVTNLIDLGFMLLIIFMIVSLGMEKEQKINVELPSESPSAQPKSDPTQQFETVTVRADGSVMLGADAMNIRQLANKFAAFARQSKPPVIELRMDAKSTAQQFVAVMDEMKKAGLTKYSFATQVKR